MKYCSFIPQRYWANGLCLQSSAVVIDTVKNEKKDRKYIQGKLRSKTLYVQKKANIMAKVNNVAFGIDNV